MTQRTRNPQATMDEKTIAEAKEKLREIAKNYRKPLHGKLALLTPLKDELLILRKKGASIAEIAGHLAECKITVSKDTVQRFLRAAKQPRPKKSKPAAAA